MKKILLYTIIISMSVDFAFAQSAVNQSDTTYYQVRDKFYQLVDEADTSEGSYLNQFKRWDWYWGQRLYPKGLYKDAAEAKSEYFDSFDKSNLGDLTPDWQPIGPNINGVSGTGRIWDIEFHPSSDDTIFVASPHGGVWKATNGGQNWIPLTDDLPIIKFSDIEIDPNNPNVIYIASGDRDDNTMRSESIGMYKTIDGGATWFAVNDGLEGLFNSYNISYEQISDILLNPNYPNIVIISTSLGLYRTTNAQTLCHWDKVYPNSGLEYEHFRDIEFKPNSNNTTIYASGIDIYQSNDYGLTWISKTGSGTGLDFDEPPFDNREILSIDITVTPDNNSIIYAAICSSAPDPNDPNKLIKYLDLYKHNGSDWEPISSPFNSGNQGRAAFAVSPSDENLLFYGQIPLKKSIDGGENWTGVQEGHADIHVVKFDPFDSNTLFIGNDGGFWSLDISQNSCTELNNDLQVGTLFNLGASAINSNEILVGQMDCGSDLYAATNNPKWDHVFGGDGMEQAIDYINPEIMYLSMQNGYLVSRSTDGGENWNAFTHPLYPEENPTQFVFPYALHSVDPNILYFGYQNIWSRTYVGNIGTWEQISYWVDDFGLSPYHVPQEIEVAPSDGDIIYTSLGLPPFALYGRIFKTSVGGGSGNWSEKTPMYNGSYVDLYITGIAIDPFDPDKVWVTYSGYDELHKVKYTSDGGDNWTEIGAGFGLPNLPVNHIVVEHGTNDLLFIGTDVGVYYKDNSMTEWEPFNDGFPNVEVQELEINYMDNKLRAATYGRGLWESPISCDYIDHNMTIESDMLITRPLRIRGNLIVENGVTLTIKGSLLFAEDSKLIVHRGGHLIVDGGTLSGACDNMWQGIEVWGIYSGQQNPVVQGWVEIENGATIENAVCGIRAVKIDNIPPPGDAIPNYTYAGGIIQATDSYFYNNQTSIQWYDYPHPSVSWIRGCEFKVDDEYIGTSPPENYVVIDNMIGVDVMYSDFKNETGTDYQYTGILSENSTIYVWGQCISGNSPCTEWDEGIFENMEYGIYATASTSTRYADIRNTIFSDNKRGAYIGGMTNARITSNKFSVDLPFSGISQYYGYGLYLDESTGYWVEDNLFYCSTCENEPLGLGMVVNQSGGDPNEIYLNEFTDVEYAINVQGENRDYYNTAIGLVIKCNEYDNTDNDETIMWESPRITKSAGIAGQQGENTLYIEDMAGNIFYYETTTTDYDDLNNEAHPIDYYYSTNAGAAKVEPLDATWSTVTKHGQLTSPWTHEMACESGINTGGGGGGDREAMNAAQTEIETTEAILTALVDGGDTEALNTEVETSTPPEAVEVYNELMSESPNLSETVVESAIEQETVLPNAMVRDVMVANPHTSKSLVLLDMLDDRFDPMPDYMKAQILAGRSIQTLKQELEAELAGHQLRKAKAMNSIIRYYREELEPQAASDSLLALYLADNTLKSRYNLSWLYFERGEYQAGENVMDNIPNQYTLDENEQEKYNNMASIYTMLSGLYENGNTITSLSANQKTALQTLSEEGSIPARAYARNILMSLGELQYEEPILFPDLLKSSKAIEEYQKLLEAEAPKQLKVYPNPSTGYVILEYELELETEANIEITDLNGRIIRTMATTGKQDQITLLTKGWKPGVYIASLKLDKKTAESIKFTLVK